MLVDANLLLYAVDSASPMHRSARQWLEHALNGTRRIGLPWASLLAFVRVSTHPRASASPLNPDHAFGYVRAWLAAPAGWIPQETESHGEVLHELIRKHDVRGNLVPDAHLVALAITHGLEIVSADSDFARFPEVRWLNPLS